MGFVGRKKEMATLIEVWEQTKAGTPQIAIIQAESGFGKTRLAQEFYSWLAQNEHGGETERAGYWPRVLGKNGDNLEVFPSSTACGDGDSDPSFIWWGLRLTDPQRRNASGLIKASVLSTIHESLLPHLATLSASIAAEDRKKARIKMIASDAILNGAGFIPVLGPLLGLGAAVRKNLEREIQANSAARADNRPDAISKSEHLKLSEQVQRLIRAVSFAPPPGLSPRPVVIFIDDAQWSDHDPEFTQFCQHLVNQARHEGWPLLLLVTSWVREWKLGSSGGNADHLSEITNLFAPEQLHLLELDKIEGLGAVVQVHFPGLSPAQIQMFESTADGNPFFMEELIRRFKRNKGDFAHRDLTQPLTPAGQDALKGTSLVELVEQRFAQASENVQMTLAMASLQGIKFSKKITVLSTRELVKFSPDKTLIEAETPYAFIRNTELDLSEFRIRHYRQAALDRLRHLFDESDAERALNTARQSLADEAPVAEQSDEDLQVLMEETSFTNVSDLHVKITTAREYFNRLRRRAQVNMADSLTLELCAEIDASILAPQTLSELTKLLKSLTNSRLYNQSIADLICAMITRIHTIFDTTGVAKGFLLKNQSDLFRLKGEICRIGGNLEEAKINYNEAIKVSEMLHGANNSTETHSDLGWLYLGLGHILKDNGDQAQAMDNYKAALKHREAIWRLSPNDFTLNSITLPAFYIAQLEANKGLTSKAREHVSQIITTRRAYFENVQIHWARRSLMQALQFMGRIYFDEGDANAAESYFEESLELACAAHTQLSTVDLAYDLFHALKWMGEIKRKQGLHQQAREYYEEAAPFLEHRHFFAPAFGTFQSLALHHELRAETAVSSEAKKAHLRQALSHSDEAYKLNSSMILLSERGRYKVKLGEHVWFSNCKKDGAAMLKDGIADLVEVADTTDHYRAYRDAAFFAVKLADKGFLRHFKYRLIALKYLKKYYDKAFSELGLNRKQAQHRFLNSPHGIG